MNLWIQSLRLAIGERAKLRGITHPSVVAKANAYGEIVVGLKLRPETPTALVDELEADVRDVAKGKRIAEPNVKRKVNADGDHIVALIVPPEMTPEVRDLIPRKKRP